MKLRSIIIIILAAAVVAGGTVVYGNVRAKDTENIFPDAGYILTSEPDSESKRVLFSGGTAWKAGLSETVSFEDVQGNRSSVPAQSFVHYADESVSAFTEGVLVDLNDVDNTRLTSHYALPGNMVLAKEDDRYVLQNTGTDLSMTDFVWKLSSEKYLFCSESISVQFAEGDVREAGSYIEVTYIDDGVIQIQTEDNIWQTISRDCVAFLENGENADLSYRNVSDGEDGVLIDFAKIVLDPDSNIEVTPLTQEMEDAWESIIPHFEVLTESGADGAAGEKGDKGVTGETGNTGEIGDSGDTGKNGSKGNIGARGVSGSAGESGMDGAGGAPGGPGGPGSPGSTGIVEGTVLNYPVFTISGWAVTSTGCSGTIMVSGVTMLNDLKTRASVDVYVVDMETNNAIRNASSTDITQFDFATERATGYPFAFRGLEPDHNYRLVVNAKINTHLEGATDYTRDFVSKTFWTDSLGVVMDTTEATADSVTLSVTKQDYAPANLKSASLFWYQTRADALNKGGRSFYTATFASAVTEEETLIALDANTTYYVRAKIELEESDGSTSGYWTDQILEARTLKRTPTVGAAALAGNRDSWGLNIDPGVSYDPDKGIVSYTYEIYDESSVNNGQLRTGATPAKRVESSADSGTLTVPVDGVNIFTGTGYYVRTVASFYDNEKLISIYSPLSNRASVDGSRRPSVYFVNAGEQAMTPSTTAADLSAWYDKMYGTLIVAPGSDTAKLLLDATHHPIVTIRASGYYYAQYPVYWYDTAAGGYTDPAVYDLEKGTFLTATKSADGGYVYVELPTSKLTTLKKDALPNAEVSVSAAGSASVYGLRPNTQYQILVTGDLTSDGTNTTETNVVVGSCVVETPDTSVVQAIWEDSDSNVGGNQFQVALRLTSLSVPTLQSGAARDFDQEDDDQQFREDISNINAVTLTLRAGNKTNPGTTLSELTLTEDNFRTVFDGDNLNSWAAEPDMTLAKALTSGQMVISEHTFGVESQKVESCGVVSLTVSSACDYTSLSKNRTSQRQYASVTDGSLGQPAAGNADGAVYINTYKLSQSTGEITHEIQLQTQPDPVPDSNKGFSVLEGVDVTGDGVKDYYLMTPNYLNTGRLARTITFYAFDAPMFEKNYQNDADWEKTAAFADKTELPKIATNVCRYGAEVGGVRQVTEVPYLGSITLTIPQTGIMPNVKFACYSKEDYFRKLMYPDDAERAQWAIDTYVPGLYTETVNRTDYYVYFLDDLQIGQPASGHQFIFAWTLTYRLESDSDTTVRYYPYEMSAFSNADTAHKYSVIPHSAPQDCPRYSPRISAIPYSSSRTPSATDGLYDFSSTWLVYVYDPQGAVIQTADGSGKAAVYERANLINGTLESAFELTVHQDRQLLGLDGFAANGDLCTLTRTDMPADGEFLSIPLAVRYQLYTDLYTNNGGGIFNGDTQIGYTPATLTYAESNYVKQASGAKVISYYLNALTVTIDPEAYRREETIGRYVDAETGGFVNRGFGEEQNWVKIEKRDVDGYTGAQATGAINSYAVTLFTHPDLLNEVNGLRLTFTPADGAPVTVDTWLDGADTVYENEVFNSAGDLIGIEKSFALRISRDLIDLAGKSGVVVSAAYLYESGEEGFGYQGGVRSLKTLIYAESNKKLTVAPSGRYLFNSSAAMAERKNTDSDDMPDFRFGGFLRVAPSIMQTETSSAVTLSVQSSRTSYAGRYAASLTGASLTNALGWRDASGLVLVPMNLVESPAIYTTVDGHNGANGVKIEKITPLISYNGGATSANSAEVRYALSGVGVSDSNIYFMIRKGTDICVWGLRDDGRTYGWIPSGDTFSDTNVITNADAARFLYNTTTGTPKANGSPNGTSNKCAGLKLRASGNMEYLGLESDEEYTIMAYYRDGSKWVRLNMMLGESEVGNYTRKRTYSEPEVSISAAVTHSSYSVRQLHTELSVTEVSNFYYTLELQNSRGDFIGYLSCGDSMDSLLSSGSAVFDIGTSGSASVGFVHSGNSVKQITNSSAAFGVDNTGAKRTALQFGSEYRVQARVYEIGKGPAYSTAYDRSADPDNLVHTISSSVATFTVPNTATAMSLVGSFAVDVADNHRPVISFKTMYVRNSADIRGGRIAIAAVRSRTDPQTGETTYTDLSEYLLLDETETDLSGATYSIGNHIIQMKQQEVGDTPLLEQDDIVTCFIYGIRDDLFDPAVTTKGVSWPSGQTDAERREMIMAGRGENGVRYSTKNIATGIEYGSSELLASYSVKYVSSEIYAGAVTVTQNAEANGYVITLVNPVNIGAISGIEYTIVATDDSDENYSPKYYNGTVDFLNVAENTYQTEIRDVSFRLQGTPNSAQYMVSLRFFTTDDTGTVVPVPMEAGGNESYNSERRMLTAVFSYEDDTTQQQPQTGAVQPPMIQTTSALRSMSVSAAAPAQAQTKSPDAEQTSAKDSDAAQTSGGGDNTAQTPAKSAEGESVPQKQQTEETSAAAGSVPAESGQTEPAAEQQN